MTNRVQTLRSSVPGNRPAAGTRATGELYVNMNDKAFGYIDAAQNPVDLINQTSTFLPLAGGTMTGQLTGTSATFTGLTLDTPAGASNPIVGESGGLDRWAMFLGTGTPETGSNAGSDFQLTNYDDSGVVLGLGGQSPLSISRASSAVAIPGTVKIGTGGPGAYLNLDNTPGTQRAVQITSSGSARWWIVADTAAESGGNAGSNLNFYRFSDAGGLIDNSLSIARATGVCTFSQPIVNGSDRRFKSDIKPADDALGKIAKLKGVFYKHKDAVKRQLGLIAQDVLPVVPEVVFETGEHGDKDPELGIAYPNLVALLINAVNELSAKVTALEGKKA